MGYLIDLEGAPAFPSLGAVGMARTRCPVERDTPLVLRAVARAVLEEASLAVGEPLPETWAARLEAKARVLDRRNRAFHRRLRRAGDEGRDWLWAFMRHWLAALVHRRRPELRGRVAAAAKR